MSWQRFLLQLRIRLASGIWCYSTYGFAHIAEGKVWREAASEVFDGMVLWEMAERCAPHR